VGGAVAALAAVPAAQGGDWRGLPQPPGAGPPRASPLCGRGRWGQSGGRGEGRGLAPQWHWQWQWGGGGVGRAREGVGVGVGVEGTA